jgi:hypothetical protein
MIERKHYTEVDRPDFEGEKNSGQQITETAGYIPANVQIEDMMLAGQRLALSRMERFDGTNKDDLSEFNDPTRRPGFDLADAHALGMQADKNLLEQEVKIKAEKAEQAKKDEEENARLIAFAKAKLAEGEKNGAS